MPLELRKCHFCGEQTRSLPILVGDIRDGDRAVLQPTAPGNALIKADPSEAGAFDSFLDALAARGLSPIANDSPL